MRYAVIAMTVVGLVLAICLLFIVFELSDLRADNQLLMQAVQDARLARCQ